MVWDVEPSPILIPGVGGYDLSVTLPESIKRGGRFGVSSTGVPLPAGMTLSPEGMLSVTGILIGTVISGVVFTYTEPE